MKIGDSIKILLSSGMIEEGMIEDVDYIDELNYHWIILSHIANPKKKLNINKKYIAAYQVEENSDISIEKEVLVINDLSLNETIVDPKLRIRKLANLRINHSENQREVFKKVIENPKMNETINIPKYESPAFLKR